MQQQSPFATKPKKKKVVSNVSFVEALKNIGGDVGSSIKKDVVQGTARGVLDSISGRFPGTTTSDKQPDLRHFEQQAQKEQQQQAESFAKLQRHKEVMAKPVFDRHEEEVKKQIQALRQELQALAKEVALVGSSMQKAIEEEIAHPGTYHVSFFEKLRSILIIMRKQASESRNWLALSSQRKAKKGGYWQNVKKSGSRYMLSGERSVVTQTG